MLHIRRLPTSVIAATKTKQFSSMSEIVKALEKDRLSMSEQKEKKFSSSLQGISLDFSGTTANTSGSSTTQPRKPSSLRDLFKKAEMSRSGPSNVSTPVQTATEAIKKDILKTLSSTSHLSPIPELEVDEMTEGEQRFLQKQQKLHINRQKLEDRLGYSPRESKEKDRIDQAIAKAMKNSAPVNANKIPGGGSKEEKKAVSTAGNTIAKPTGDKAPSTSTVSHPPLAVATPPTRSNQIKRQVGPTGKVVTGAHRHQPSPQRAAVAVGAEEQRASGSQQPRQQDGPSRQQTSRPATPNTSSTRSSAGVQSSQQPAAFPAGRPPVGGQQQQAYHPRSDSWQSTRPRHQPGSHYHRPNNPNGGHGGHANGYAPRPHYTGSNPSYGNNNYNNSYSYPRFPYPSSMPDMFSENTPETADGLDQRRSRFRRHDGYKEVVPGRLESNTNVVKPPVGVMREVVIPTDGLTVRDIARELALKIETVVEKLAALGEGQEGEGSKKAKFRGKGVTKQEANGIEDKLLDADVTELVILELGFNCRRANEQERVDNRSKAKEDGVVLVPRPPMVTIMGHVDHGKTTLLDSLRALGAKGSPALSEKTGKASKGEAAESSSDMEKLVEGEAGGITQKLSAFTVSYTPPDSPALPIVVVDTPGHAAFSAMRHMGGGGADAIILVVALDSGIQPQTIEGIKLAQRNNIPLIVALNKADKYALNERKTVVNKLIQALTLHNVLTREMGGDVPAVLISGKTGLNIEELLKEVHDLSGSGKATAGEAVEEGEDVGDGAAASLQKKLLVAPTGPAEGVLLDSFMEKGRGVVCSLVVTWGELQTGDHVVIGQTYGKVRALYDEKNNKINSAAPGSVVKMLGLKDLPPLSAPIICVDSESEARKICERRAKLAELKEMRAHSNIEGNKTISPAAAPEVSAVVASSADRSIKVILKAESLGSLEALKVIVNTISRAAKQYDCEVRIIHSHVGEVNMSDVDLISENNSDGNNMILAFNVGLTDGSVRQKVKGGDVNVCMTDIIYRLEEELVKKVEEFLPREEIVTKEGSGKVMKLFNIKDSVIAGCQVTCGTFYTNNKLNTAGGEQYSYRLTRPPSPAHPQGEVVEIAFDRNKKMAVELKRFKDSVRSVEAGHECGLSIANWTAYQEGDVVECYKTVYKPKSLLLNYDGEGKAKRLG